MGTTLWALDNVKLAAQTGGKALLLIGDFAYANGYNPRWDFFQRMMSNYLSSLPIMFCYGNHEMDGQYTYKRVGCSLFPYYNNTLFCYGDL